MKFVRGSVVWIPSTEGEYEVLAVAIDDQGNAVASATRRVIVGENQPPEITITGGPTTPSASAQNAIFTTEIIDPDDEPITRVEFYDNGVLIGTDRSEPFGNSIRDLEFPGYQYSLLRGIHNITARAFNARGSIGETTQAFVVEITGGNARPSVDEITSPVGSLIVQQGQTFAVAYTVSDPDGASDLARVEAKSLQEGGGSTVTDSSSPFNGLTMDTTGWQPGSHTIIVRAFDNAGAFSYPATFTVFVQTAAGPTFAEQLVANLVYGISVAPSGEEFTGAQLSSGEFEEGFASGLQMDEGILLTTGKFEFWNGGNEAEDKTYEWFLPGDDRLRDRLSGGEPTYVTHDAAAIEFDVFSQNSQLEFEFQFGSEEFPEWVGEFNDGFLITVNDTIVSLLPDCSDIVSVDSVNDVFGYDQNRHLYLNNNINGFGVDINDTDIAPDLDPNDLHRLVEYDGLTIKLRGHVLVEAGVTYRIRIVIADAQDRQYDSGLFLQSNSLRSITPNP